MRTEFTQEAIISALKTKFPGLRVRVDYYGVHLEPKPKELRALDGLYDCHGVDWRFCTVNIFREHNLIEIYSADNVCVGNYKTMKGFIGAVERVVRKRADAFHTIFIKATPCA